jgi:hypothetical protein
MCSDKLPWTSIFQSSQYLFRCFLQQPILRFVSCCLHLEPLSINHLGSPSTQDEFDQYQAAMTNFYNAATRDTTPPGIMEHLGAVELIQDWDSMRAALGYEKVSFGGVS